MAKQESNYSKEDKEAFKERDLRITKLSCLDRATSIAIAFWTHPLLKQIDATNVQSVGVAEICKMAETFVSWVYGNAQNAGANTNDREENGESKPSIHETPLSEQEKVVMREIIKSLSEMHPNKKIDVTSLHTYIWNKYGKYPQNIQSVVKIVNEIDINLECLK